LMAVHLALLATAGWQALARADCPFAVEQNCDTWNTCNPGCTGVVKSSGDCCCKRLTYGGCCQYLCSRESCSGAGCTGIVIARRFGVPHPSPAKCTLSTCQ